MNRLGATLLTLVAVLALTLPAASCSQGGEQAAEEGPADVTGTWNLTFDSSMGAIIWKVNFQQDGTALTGTVELESGAIEIENGSVEEGGVSFQIESGMGGHGFALTFNGTLSGNEMTGTISGGANEGAAWTARRAE